MRRIVIAGTGTDVGKTVFTAGLVRDAIDQGIWALGVKPLETGPQPESDSARLGEVSGRVVPPFFRFPEPISPHLASRRAGRVIAPDEVAGWVLRQTGCETLVVETAGGLLSPISDRHANADWMALIPWTHRVLVCPGRLGVLHDVGAALAAAPDIAWSLLVVSAVEGRPEAELQAAEISRAVLPRLSRSFPVRVFSPDDRPWSWIAGGSPSGPTG